MYAQFKELLVGNSGRTDLYPIPADESMQLIDQTRSEPLYFFPGNTSKLSFPMEHYKPAKFGGETFDPQNSAHTKYIANCTKAFKKELHTLQTLDRSLQVCAVAYVLTAIPQSIMNSRPYAGSISAVAAQSAWTTFINNLDELIGGYGVCFILGNRQGQFKRYALLLERMKHNLAWSLGYWTADTSAEQKENLLNNKELMEMVLALSPVLALQEIQNIIADSVEPSFLDHAHQLQSAYDQRRQEVDLALYGSNSKSLVTFATAAPRYLLDLGYNGTKSALQYCGYFTPRHSNPPQDGRKEAKHTIGKFL